MRRSPRHLGCGVLLAGWLAAAGPLTPPTLAADDALPELGTWEVTVNAPGGTPFKATVSFVRRDRNRVFGVIEWSPAGPTKTLELFSATAGAADAIQLFGREEHTLVADQFPTRYEATLGAGGRQLTGFRSTGLGATDSTGTAKWVRAAVPKYSPAVTAALNLTGERHLLRQQLSANYVLDGTAVKFGPDTPLLRELVASRDKGVGELAQVKLSVQEMHEQGLARDAATAAQWAKGDGDRRELVYKLLAGAFLSGSSLNPVANLFNSIGIKKAFDGRRAGIELACVRVAAANRIRSELRADYQTRTGATAGALRGKVTAGFKVAAGGGGMIALRNDTAGDLHHVSVTTRMAVDQKVMDRYAADNDGKELLSGLLLVAAGVDAKNVVAIFNYEAVADQYFRLEKGSPAFVPLWPKGAVLEVPLGMTEDLRLIAESVGAWVGADEGQTDIALDLETVRKVIRAELDKKSPGPIRKR